MYLVSACLAGFNCRYDGNNCINEGVFKLVSRGEAIPVCPEILGGLVTPRNPVEIKISPEGEIKLYDKKGNELTEVFKKGAHQCLKLAMLNSVKIAIFKSKSPSCGFGMVYDGSFTGKLVEGNGIAADLLNKNGIKILNEENYKGALKESS